MNTKSNKILHLLAFSSVMCLSAGHAIASTGSDTPALQISNERWTPPSPPSESPATTTQSPAAQAGNGLWQASSALLTKPGSLVKKEDISRVPVTEVAEASEPSTPALVVSDEVWQPSAAKKETASASAATPVTPTPVAAAPSAKTDQQQIESLRRNAILVPVKTRSSEQAAAESKEAGELQGQIDNLSKQNADLQAKLKTASETPVKSAEDKAAIEALQSQIDSLAKQNVELEGRLKMANEQKSAEPAAAASLTADQNAQVLKTMQDQIDTLARGNLELQEKLRNASAAPSEPVVATVSGPAVKKKASDGHTVTTQKSYLRADFRTNTEEARQAAAVAPASGNPQADATLFPDDSAVVEVAEPKAVKPVIAEKPTYAAAEEEIASTGLSGEIEKLKNRYKQSEAENAKLGDMVKVVKDQCEQEKSQMQSMLFDPQIADEQQRAYISDLEQQLGEAQAALAEQKRSYELKIRLLKNSKGIKTKSES